ncbi:VOC family protein [Ningiella sp. W23]|uniref:VOC family protein n=1 Tax=Ningiella sp. W23 TaxID=3023715 RepID=UPI003757157E
MDQTGKINYIEMPSTNLAVTKSFFAEAFAWKFVDYGEEYVALQDAGIDGGFYLFDKPALAENGSVLVVLYSDLLEQTRDKVKSCGAKISQDIFSFPGGRRFHFIDPTGNEFAVWSDKEGA